MGKDKEYLTNNNKMPKQAAKSQANKTASKVAKPVSKAVHKVYTKPRFFRPKTKTQARTPKLMKSIRKVVGKEGQASPYKVLLYPLTSDKTNQQMENENTLTFIVALKANKSEIKKTVESLLQVKVRNVNTLVRPDGKKKAYIRLSPNHDALKLAAKIGIL